MVSFAFSFEGIVDLLAVLPFYLAIGVDPCTLRVLRLFRLLRLFKIHVMDGRCGGLVGFGRDPNRDCLLRDADHGAALPQRWEFIIVSEMLSPTPLGAFRIAGKCGDTHDRRVWRCLSHHRGRETLHQFRGLAEFRAGCHSGRSHCFGIQLGDGARARASRALSRVQPRSSHPIWTCIATEFQ